MNPLCQYSGEETIEDGSLLPSQTIISKAHMLVRATYDNVTVHVPLLPQVHLQYCYRHSIRRSACALAFDSMWIAPRWCWWNSNKSVIKKRETCDRNARGTPWKKGPLLLNGLGFEWSFLSGPSPIALSELVRAHYPEARGQELILVDPPVEKAQIRDGHWRIGQPEAAQLDIIILANPKQLDIIILASPNFFCTF